MSLELITDSCPFQSNKLELSTKNIAFQQIRKGLKDIKLVVSTRLLEATGWTKGTLINETVIGLGKGLRITKAIIGQKSDKKVYDRKYAKRKERETLLDIRHQGKIIEASLGASRAHIVIQRDEIIIKPIANVQTYNTKGGEIVIPNTIAPDLILDVLDTIETHKLSHIDIIANQDFLDSHDALLLKTQLLRKGYQVLPSDTGLSCIAFEALETLEKNRFELTQPISITAPPFSENATGSIETFVGMSGGVDAHCLEKEGYTVKYGLEYRPNEPRDGDRDKSDLYAISLAENSSLTHLFNENIFEANIDFIADQSRHVEHSHFSLSCTDYTPLKCAKDKEKAFKDLSTTRDMFIPLLSLIEKQAPLTISIENVTPFASSRECEILIHRLKRIGYKVGIHKLSAPDFGGLTGRNRCYIFASLHSMDIAPKKTLEKQNAWEAIKYDFDKMNDITHTKSVQKGITSGRLRPFHSGKDVAPVITRSQDRGTKDALTISLDGRYYKPTINQLRTLMGIPDSFNLSFLTKEAATEVIGQSVDVPMHKAWCLAIKTGIIQAK